MWLDKFLFVEETITSNVYLDMLENYGFPQIKHFENDNEFCTVFQQGKAPPCSGNNVHNTLNARYSEQWTGRNQPNAWLPSSPDLIPLDFFLCGHVKSTVYWQNIGDMAYLKERITRGTVSITLEILNQE